jgi:hypothetical protein
MNKNTKTDLETPFKKFDMLLKTKIDSVCQLNHLIIKY